MDAQGPASAQRILAVDDEPHMLKLLERIITEKTAYQITTTSNSLEVPGLLDAGAFDLIVSDLKMPGLDGMDILRLIKEKGRDEELIIITAFGSLETAIEALSLGVFDYITKPFKREQIIYTVDRVMRWQTLKRESKLVGEIFGLEPYAEARRAFERQYVQRLARRCDGDVRTMAERSGMSAEDIAATMRQASAGA
ncbi:MAG: response regulator [Phycisphaerae bacterium]|nr:response regulator [Phycisphaerae bacterium]